MITNTYQPQHLFKITNTYQPQPLLMITNTYQPQHLFMLSPVPVSPESREPQERLCHGHCSAGHSYRQPSPACCGDRWPPGDCALSTDQHARAEGHLPHRNADPLKSVCKGTMSIHMAVTLHARRRQQASWTIVAGDTGLDALTLGWSDNKSVPTAPQARDPTPRRDKCTHTSKHGYRAMEQDTSQKRARLWTISAWNLREGGIHTEQEEQLG